MLRVEICDSAETLILRLEGRFTGDDAEYTRTLAARFAARRKLLVDLTEVVFIDAVGEEVLSFLGQLGAEFVAPNSYAARCVRASEFAGGPEWRRASARVRGASRKRRPTWS